ncbi:MAG: ATP-binding protein [Clostridia bacterium]|nr:ATP-binding protein [Clostridia bacterium]MBR0437694.1 ATP-binding protein [Clostridia bacterium]MBR6822079.1 ATP-binding protein [Clostridia bacterium]
MKLISLAELIEEYDDNLSRRSTYEALRERDVLRAHPVLENLIKQRNAVQVDYLQMILREPHRKNELEEEARPILTALDQQIGEYREQNNVTEEPPHYECDICQDTGFAGDGYCICLKKKAYVRVIGAYDLESFSGDLSDYSFEIFTDPDDKARASKMVRYLKKQYEDYPVVRKKQLVLLGKAGTGKTYVIRRFLRTMAEKEQDICYISARNLFDYFHQDRLGETDGVDLLYEAKILAIDDLGSEPMTQNVTREYLFDLMNVRKEKGLLTVFVSNNNLDELNNRYTERIVSRLLSVNDSDVFQFEGKDLRLVR